jgi:hypothetical protein
MLSERHPERTDDRRNLTCLTAARVVVSRATMRPHAGGRRRVMSRARRRPATPDPAPAAMTPFVPTWRTCTEYVTISPVAGPVFHTSRTQGRPMG